MVTEALEQFIGHIAVRERYGVRVLQSDSLLVRVVLAGGVPIQVEDFRRGHPDFAANGSVEVLSEHTPVEAGHSSIDQRNQRGGQQSRLMEAAPHTLRAAKDGWSPSIDPMIEEHRTPSLLLCLKDPTNVPVGS